MNKPSNQPMDIRTIIMLIAGFYAISPIDIVPDVPIIGWGDDIVVVALALALVVLVTGGKAIVGSGKTQRQIAQDDE